MIGVSLTEFAHLCQRYLLIETLPHASIRTGIFSFDEPSLAKKNCSSERALIRQKMAVPYEPRHEKTYAKSKGRDQLRGNRDADQLPKSEMLRF